MNNSCILGIQLIIPGIEIQRTEVIWIHNATFEIKDNYLYVKEKGYLDSIYNMANVARILIR